MNYIYYWLFNSSREILFGPYQCREIETILFAMTEPETKNVATITKFLTYSSSYELFEMWKCEVKLVPFQWAFGYTKHDEILFLFID